MKKLIVSILFVIASGIAGAQAINCGSGFTTSGACGVSTSIGGSTFWNPSSTGIAGPTNILPSGLTHAAGKINKQGQVNVQAFTTTFTFVPNGQNIAFLFNNTNNNPGFEGPTWSGGAGCEAGLYQSAGGIPNYTFAVKLDSFSPLTFNGSFTYSSVQIYQSSQPPCLPPNGGETQFYPTTQISTSPVALNSPSNSQGTTTGDTYSATLIYDGTILTLNLYDVTAGGTCSPITSGTCYHNVWNDINIPAMVGGPTFTGAISGTTLSTSSVAGIVAVGQTVVGNGVTAGTTITGGSGSTWTVNHSQSVSSEAMTGANTAYPSIVGATGNPASTDLLINSWVYTVNTPPSSPSVSNYTTTAAAGGIITLTGSISGTTLNVTSVSPNVVIIGQSLSGSGITPGTVITARAGGTGGTGNYTVNNSQTVGSETITASLVALSPTVSPAAGSYGSAQTVTVTSPTPNTYVCGLFSATTPPVMPWLDSQGACYNSSLITSTISVPSTGSLYLVSGANVNATCTANNCGMLPSSVVVAAYTIGGTPTATAPVFSPGAGTYTGTQTVTASNPSSAPTGCSTTNGATPATNGTTGCTTGTLYSSSISVATSETLKMVWGGTGFLDSSVTSAAYTINIPTSPSSLSGVILSGGTLN